MQAFSEIDWWRGAVGYEIYVRSFADSNGDGVGDLPGITAKLPYLADLGVDVVWITPFMSSPGFDHGYDVSDYCDINPLHGTLADWDALAARAEQLGLKVFVDMVPNHTSSHHRWFQQAVADPTGPYRDYYVWADPAADGGPPNNWLSHFGGPAWTLDPGGSGQYYCHLFLPEQPDLNWANPRVMDEFAGILNFWCDRGADGFRIDVAHGLTKDPELRSNPEVAPLVPGMHPQEAFVTQRHIYDLHRQETALLFRQWRAAVADRGAILLGEMDTRDVARFSDFVADGTALHAGFVLQVGLGEWRPAHILRTMLEYQRTANGGCAWEVSNHDQARAVSRYGGGDTGLRRAMSLSALMNVFDGMFFLYQGEELGLPDAVLTGVVEDPMSSRNGEGMWTRDVSRGPMPWDDGPVNGFTTGDAAWLATTRLPAELTAAHQMTDPTSVWHGYRDLVRLRKQYPELWRSPFELVEHGDEHVIIRRGDLVVVANLGAAPVDVSMYQLGRAVYSSGAQPQGGSVAGETTAIFTTAYT